MRPWRRAFLRSTIEQTSGKRIPGKLQPEIHVRIVLVHPALAGIGVRFSLTSKFCAERDVVVLAHRSWTMLVGACRR